MIALWPLSALNFCKISQAPNILIIRPRTAEQTMRNWLFHIPFFSLKPSFLFFHREVRGQGHLKSSEPRAGRGSVSCSKATSAGWMLANTGVRDSLFNHWGPLPSMMLVMLRLWPQIKAGVALQPQSWCQSKPIRPVMTDGTWPNPCESRGKHDWTVWRKTAITCVGNSYYQSSAYSQTTELALALAATRPSCKELNRIYHEMGISLN